MDVQTIADCCQLMPRKIRYVIDQRILPGARGKLQTHLAGRPRSFTAFEGYAIALAAAMLEGGIRRQTVAEVLDRLVDLTWPIPGTADRILSPKERAVPRPKTAMEAIYWGDALPAELLIGDGVNLRLHLGQTQSNWIEPRTRALLAEHYEPRLLIRLELGRLRTACRKAPEW
jgi:hypothetical protein